MSASAAHGQRALAGIALALAATAFFAALDTTTKHLGTLVPMVLVLWCRYTVQALATAAAVLPTRGRRALRMRHPGLMVLRGLMLLSVSLLAFASLQVLPVGEFTAILMITPLAVTLLAATVLGERVSPLRWLLVAGGFAGTLVIIRPGGAYFGWAVLLPLALVATNAAFQVLTSKLARTEDPLTMHLVTGWVGAIGCSLALPLAWTTLPDPRLWLLLGFVGAAATVGHFLLILAYQRAPAATLTPVLYAQIAFATLGGWLVFSHVPDGWSVAGMLLIAACGMGGAWLTVHESRTRAAALGV